MPATTPQIRPSSLLRTTATAVVALLLGVGASGCGAVAEYEKSISDSWAVTYEISLSGAGTGQLSDITYLESEQRGEAGTQLTLPSGKATADGNGKQVWSVESIVTAQEDAAVSAVPDAGVAATCRILLDESRQIATSTSAPGERVDCTASTPAFSE